MTDDQQTKSSAHDPQAALRAALKRALPFYSPQQMIDAAIGSRPAWKGMTDTALRTFITSIDGTMLQANFDALAAYWLYTPLGRALRYPDPKSAPSFDQLSHKLATGRRTLPEGKTVDGLYFLYHGSYIQTDCFAVRVIEIDSKDDQILTVRDTIYDTITLTEDDRDAHGALVFVGERPHILLYGRENKLGFSLMTGTEPAYDRVGQLNRLAGAFLVMNKGDAAAYRHFYMVRKPDGDRKQMLAESGIFTREQLRAPERKHHSDAFDKLATPNLVAEPPFPDPMLAYKPDPKS